MNEEDERGKRKRRYEGKMLGSGEQGRGEGDVFRTSGDGCASRTRVMEEEGKKRMKDSDVR